MRYSYPVAASSESIRMAFIVFQASTRPSLTVTHVRTALGSSLRRISTRENPRSEVVKATVTPSYVRA